MRRRWLAVFLAFLFFSLLPVSAEEKSEDELWADFKELLPNAAADIVPESPKDTGEAVGFSALFSLLADTFTGTAKAEGGRIGCILGLSLAFSALSLTVGTIGKTRVGKLLWEALPALLLFRLLYPTVTRIFEALSALGAFSLGASGVYTTLFASAGALSSAALAASGFGVFVGILNGMLTGILLPLLKILFALAVLSAFSSVGAVGGIGKQLSSAYLWFLSLASVLFTASLALESGIASSADSVAARTVKFAVGGAIPVVGGTVSSALSALGASLSLLKSAMGASSLVALAVLLLPLLCELLLLRFALSLAAFLAESLGDGATGGVFARYKSIFDLMLAALAIVSLLFVIFLGILAGRMPLPL